MTFACLAIAAAVCVDKPAKIAVDKTAMWSGAVFNFNDGSSLISEIASDVVNDPDIKAMTRICVRNICLVYSQNCELFKEFDYRCTIYYISRLKEEPKRIVIAGGDISRVNNVKKHASIYINGTVFPLDILRTSPFDKFPPFRR